MVVEQVVQGALCGTTGMEGWMTNLDRPVETTRQCVEERRKDRQVVGTEGGRKLDHERTEPCPERLHALEKSSKQFLRVPQSPVVGDLAAV